MPITPINVGTAPNNGTGEELRIGGQKINANFTYLKQYADNLIQGLKWKQRVDLATTANVVLSGEQTIDGTLTSASRVLVKDQTNQTENGIYTTSAVAWTRTSDADLGSELVNATVSITSGTANANTNWTSNASSIELGVTDVIWVRFQGADGVDQGTFDAAIALINDTIDLLTARVQALEDNPSGYVLTAQSIIDALNYTPADDANVLHTTGNETKTGDLTVNGKLARNHTETNNLSNRTVIDSLQFKANPSAPVAQVTDFHAVDMKHAIEGANINSSTNIYPFEIQGYTASSIGASNVGGIVDFYTLIEHYGQGILAKAIGYQIWNRNRSTGTITDSKGILIKNPLNDGGGAITDSYGIFIEKHTTATTKNYAIWANGKTYLEELIVNNVPFTSVISGANERGSNFVSNADSILKSGFYSTNTGTTGTPFSGFWGINHNQIYNLDVYATQFAVNYISGEFYTRKKDNNTWSVWEKVVNETTIKNTARTYTAQQNFAGTSGIKEHEINGTRITANVATTYALDWNAGSQFVLTPTAAVTLSNANLPVAPNTKVISGVFKAASFAVTFPSSWKARANNDPLSATLDTHFTAETISDTVILYTLENIPA